MVGLGSRAGRVRGIRACLAPAVIRPGRTAGADSGSTDARLAALPASVWKHVLSTDPPTTAASTADSRLTVSSPTSAGHGTQRPGPGPGVLAWGGVRSLARTR